MFENLTDAVGFAMHEDRLARAARDRRLSEAEQARTGTRDRSRSGRQAVAHRLRALAAWLTPGDVTREASPA